MSDAVKVTVTDPVTGEVLGETIVNNDYVLICAGMVYLHTTQRYSNGTTQLTLKRGSAAADLPVPALPEETPHA